MDKDKCDHATRRSDSVPGDSFSVVAPAADILREALFYPTKIGDAGSTISLARLMHKNDRSAIDPEEHWSQGSFVLMLRGLRPWGKRVMPGLLRAAACLTSIVGAALILLATATGALAEDKRTVQAGASVVIVPPSEKVLADKSGPLKGTVSVIESTTTPKTYSFIYLAPKTTVDFTDAVKYSDGTDHTVLVSVTADGEPPTLTSPEIYAQSFKALFVLFIIAIILESGLAVIFNWRPFIQLFDARGVKTIVSFLFAWLFVSAFDLDIVTHLVNVYSQKSYSTGFPGTFVTALVLAGGSSGVNNLLVALGFRSVRTADQAAPKPPHTEAWISVRLIRASAVGPVNVLIGPQGAPLPVSGTITGSSSTSALRRFFLRDYGRFPTAGGFAVPPGTQLYEVKLKGMDKDGKQIESTLWGPYPLAPKAIVDIEFRL